MAVWKEVMIYRNVVAGETALNQEINLRSLSNNIPWASAKFIYNVIEVTFGSSLSYDVEVQHVRDDVYKFINKSGNPLNIKVAWIALEVDDFSGTSRRDPAPSTRAVFKKKTILKKHGILLANPQNSYIIDTRNLSTNAFDKISMVPSVVSANFPPSIRGFKIKKAKIDSFRYSFKLFAEGITNEGTQSTILSKYFLSRTFNAFAK